MKILLKAQACLPLLLPLEFVLTLPLTSQPPGVLDASRRVAREGQGPLCGALITRGLAAPTRPPWLPSVLRQLWRRGLCSQRRGRWPHAPGPLPAIVSPSPFTRPALPQARGMLCACPGAPILPATGRGLWAPGTRGGRGWVPLWPLLCQPLGTQTGRPRVPRSLLSIWSLVLPPQRQLTSPSLRPLISVSCSVSYCPLELWRFLSLLSVPPQPHRGQAPGRQGLGSVPFPAVAPRTVSCTSGC